MKQKIIFISILIILVLLLFFGLGEKILYSKSIKEQIIPVLLVFIGIPVSLFYKSLKLFVAKKSASNITALSILILGPAFGLWTKYLSEHDMRDNGMKTYGVVTAREWTNLNNRGRWTITAKFKYKSNTYVTFSKDDNDNIYRINDKILVRFSKRNPENNEIIL